MTEPETFDTPPQPGPATDLKLGVPVGAEPPIQRLHDLLSIMGQMERSERRAALAYMREFYEVFPHPSHPQKPDHALEEWNQLIGERFP